MAGCGRPSRVDFEKTNMDPITNVAWFLRRLPRRLRAHRSARNMVPDSFEWDRGRPVHVVRHRGDLQAERGDAASAAAGTSWTSRPASARRRCSTASRFYRPDPSRPSSSEVIDEKDAVNKKYGSVQGVQRLPRRGDRSPLRRRACSTAGIRTVTEPVDVLLHHPAFPERFKPMFDGDLRRTRTASSRSAGASLQVPDRELRRAGPGDGRARHASLRRPPLQLHRLAPGHRHDEAACSATVRRASRIRARVRSSART